MLGTLGTGELFISEGNGGRLLAMPGLVGSCGFTPWARICCPGPWLKVCPKGLLLL